MDYSKWTDAEINAHVGKIISFDKLSMISSDGRALIHEHKDIGNYEKVCLGWKVFDPCNNPADAWPIIQESGISIVYDGDDWLALHFSRPSLTYPSDHRKHPNKPFRAALILWLMMQEGE